MLGSATMNTFDCQTAEPSLYLYRDRQLDELDQLALESHLEVCPDCAEHEKFVARMVALVREKCPRQLASDPLKDKILKALRDCVR